MNMCVHVSVYRRGLLVCLTPCRVASKCAYYKGIVHRSVFGVNISIVQEG